MKDTTDNQELLDSIRAELDHGVESLDAVTRSRLRQIRARAMAGAGRKRTPRFLIPVGLAVTTCLVAIVISFVPGQQAIQENMVEDLDLMFTPDGLEFYEDLEFYEWLEEHA